jgi:trimethylamine--corrinoid protein Co-methyltransferase
MPAFVGMAVFGYLVAVVMLPLERKVVRMDLRCRPALNFLDKETITQTIERAYGLLENPGIKINNAEALDILGQNGAKVDLTKKMVRINADLINRALNSVPESVDLYNQQGNKAVTAGGDNISFVAGSSAPFILDAKTGQPRPALTADLINFLRLSDSLPYIHHANPSLIPSDVPDKIKDTFRCFLALLNSSKPLTSGTTELGAVCTIKDMLVTVTGSEAKMKEKPRLSFACCPKSPLTWDEISCQNLIDCAKYSIPVRIIPAPISGATAPVTLMGTIVQHTAENLSGIVIHQLAQPGAPLIYGTAATVMDMRSGTSLFGSIESKMINVANGQVGRFLGMPCYALVAFSDAKLVDAQAGLESMSGILLGVLAGISMLSGPGMLGSGLCQSFEKLVIDNEICGMGKRLISGISCTDDAYADNLIGKIAPDGNFLSTEHTFSWMKNEQFYPSTVIHRASMEDFQARGGIDAYQEAREVVHKVFKEYEPIPLSEDIRKELVEIMTAQAKKCGMDQLTDYGFKI